MTQWLIQHRWRTGLDPATELIDPRSEPMTGLPQLGRVSAGHPLEAIEDPDWIQSPQRLARGASYALRVQGDSMRDEHIEDGDLVLLNQRTTAEDGETVVALIDDGPATLKRLYQTPGGLRLQPANPDYAPLHRPQGAVEVIGVVVAVMREVEAP
ncbi:MAG: peptidase [Gammaproteobacteria bacterium]|jgi:repressor LexA|nr:peptidase [Gammaproteobacteria bacterium]